MAQPSNVYGSFFGHQNRPDVGLAAGLLQLGELAAGGRARALDGSPWLFPPWPVVLGFLPFKAVEWFFRRARFPPRLVVHLFWNAAFQVSFLLVG